MDFKAYTRAQFFKWAGATDELFESWWSTYKGALSNEEDAFYEGRRIGFEAGQQEAKRQFRLTQTASKKGNK